MRLTAEPNAGLGTWPARRARISPDRIALLDPNRSLTYTEFADRTSRFAAALRRIGVGPGDRVAYLYRLDLAKPKRPATPAQLAAVGKALTARRTCRHCGITRPYYIPRSTGACLICEPGGPR